MCAELARGKANLTIRIFEDQAAFLVGTQARAWRSYMVLDFFFFFVVFIPLFFFG